MTYDDYWYATPLLVKTYYKCHKLQMEQRNQEMWWQGMYFLKAMECVMSSAFGKKGSEIIEYPKEPVPLSPKKDDTPTEYEAEKERQKAIASFMNLQSAMERKFNNGEQQYGNKS